MESLDTYLFWLICVVFVSEYVRYLITDVLYNVIMYRQFCAKRFELSHFMDIALLKVYVLLLTLGSLYLLFHPCGWRLIVEGGD